MDVQTLWNGIDYVRQRFANLLWNVVYEVNWISVVASLSATIRDYCTFVDAQAVVSNEMYLT